LRHANLSPTTTPPRTQTPTTSPPRLHPSPGKIDLASLVTPPKRDLQQDTPMEPPAQPLSFTPVNVPEAIPEAEEDDDAMKQDGRTSEDEVDEELQADPSDMTPARPRPSVYSRAPISPVYSPDGVTPPLPAP
ncbi:hypothetical protein FRB99_003182, partial [Tulasnella sp. 403]